MCTFEFWIFFKNDLLPKKICWPHPKILACITPLQNMSPPPIYPWLPHLHNHGLATLACITPVRGMRPPPIYWSHLQKKFLKNWFSPQISSKPQSPQEAEHEKKEGKRKASIISSNKRGSQYFERRKTLKLQKFFLMWFHFLPLQHIISKTLSKVIEKIFLTFFGPSFSMAIYMTWVVPIFFTHELHIFSP
jgi:hypothetical protein